MLDKETLTRIRKIIADAKSIAFLGGAGVSTGSGIPDFRSPQGLYNIRLDYNCEAEEILSHDFFYDHPDIFYDFYWKYMVSKTAKPCKAHYALAEFQKRGKITVITQNIDGLHTMAGSKGVLEAHGSVFHYHCPKCGKAYDLPELEFGKIPHCSCGTILKPDVVLYGEPLDEDTLTRAVHAVEFANVLIIGGTSMRVYPIAGLPRYFNMGTQIIINAEETPYDRYCDFVIHEDIGDTLEAILGE